MPWQQNSDVITHILEEAGFDTIVSQTINGIKDDGETNHQVFINPQGRIRYQFSELLNHTSDTTVILGREFDINKENRNIVNIMGELESFDELVKFLQNVSEMTREGVTK